LENPSYTRICGVLQEYGILLGVVSDCEELSGGYSQEIMEEGDY
jgi:hypothetical protein